MNSYRVRMRSIASLIFRRQSCMLTVGPPSLPVFRGRPLFLLSQIGFVPCWASFASVDATSGSVSRNRRHVESWIT